MKTTSYTLKKTIYSAQRGMLELGFLMPFAKEYLPTLDEESLQDFIKLMKEDDKTLLSWILSPQRCTHQPFLDHILPISAHLKKGL